MNKFVLAAALALGACAHEVGAQVIVSGYQQGYYNYSAPNYYPGYGGGFQQPGGYSSYGYSNYSYQSYPTYSYPSYGYSNYSPALSAYNSFYRRGGVSNNSNYRFSR